ncbi:MAG: hypothetical protein FWG93_00815, partial [Oscillospiraceae bacterium]|nr:hypothetical protein [Oscillospiraceae bacterium]
EKLGQTLAIWVAATPKKPATAPQFIHTAWRAIMPEVNQPTFTNTAVRLDTKTYEVERPDKPGTWTTSVVRPTRAGTVEYNIRAKATAKAGRENSTTFAASEPGKLVLTWGIVNEERNTMGYTDAYIVAPREYKGVVRGLTKAEPQKRVEGDSEEITLEYTINGLHTGSGTLVFKSDSKATPETNEILIVPKVEGGSDKSVSITGALVDTTLTLTVMPVQAATVTVGLEIKFGSGLHTNENPNPSETIPDNLADLNAIAKEKLYFEKMSGGRGVKITITPIEGTFEISEVVTDSGSVVRAEVKTKAVGAANLLTAANASNIGTLSISQDGVLKLSDLKGISGTGTSAAIISGNSSEWEFFTNSGPIDDKINLNDIPSESIYPMNNIKSVSHNWFLIIRYTPSSGATIHYVFKTVDDVRPQITDATYGSNTITVTFDEPLKGSSTISGFHIQQAGTPTIQPIGAGTATAGTDKVTIENVSGLSGLYILHYNPTSGDLPAEDGNGNRAAATQAYLEGTGGAAPVLQSITFGNGVDGGMPITFAIPPAATLIGNYDNEIVYVPLNAGNQPVTVTLKGTSVGNAGFTVLSSRTSNPQYYNQFNASGEALIVGLNANTYLYVRVGTNHYCFYISRKSGANGSAAASFSSAAINKDSSSVYTITLSFSGTASPIGRLSATNFSIGGGNSAGITVEAARFEKSEVTLTLGGPNLGNLNSASKLDVVYTGNQFDCILGPGGLNGKLTDQTVTVNMNKLPAPSPAPTGS